MKLLKHLRSDWFRYGFETIAVIVGILVAFALDNWNEKRKQDILEVEFLHGLETDLASDTVYYNRRIADSERIKENHRDFVFQMYQVQNSIEEVRLLFKLAGFNSEHLTTHNSTYLELTNSGNLSILSNRILKDKIIDYYRENERAATHISEFNEVSSRHLIEIGNVVKNLQKLDPTFEGLYNSSFTVQESEWAFINDPLSEKFKIIEYTIAVYRMKHIAFLNHFHGLKNQSVQLINNIKTDLETR